jgi:Tol biopolymer transport system component
VFVRDMSTEAVVRVSVHRNGAEATKDSVDPSIAADGRSVSFVSLAGLVLSDTDKALDVYVSDLARGQLRQASVEALDLPNTNTRTAELSAAGRHVVFAASASEPDFTNVEAAYVRDRFDAPVVRGGQPSR